MVGLDLKKIEEKIKEIVIITLIIISVLLFYYFEIILKNNIIYSHFYYIPIILACIWWRYRGLVVSMFLVGLLIFFPFILGLRVNILDNLDNFLRGTLIIGVSIVVAVLSSHIFRTENELKDRVKELNCLYEIIKLIENPNISVGEILNGSLKHIQNTWRFPDITCAKITFDQKEYKTDNFTHTPWNISDSVMIRNKNLKIEIHYLENKPLLIEARDLLKEIVRQLRAVFEFKLVWTA